MNDTELDRYREVALFRYGLIADLVTLEPLYLQKSQAEIRFEQRNQKNN